MPAIVLILLSAIEAFLIAYPRLAADWQALVDTIRGAQEAGRDLTDEELATLTKLASEATARLLATGEPT